MNKYDPLRDYVAGLDQTSVTMSFVRVEQFVGPLPASARKHRSWWANDSKIEAPAFRAAGWHVDSVDQRNERVLFAIGRVGGSHLEARTDPRQTGAIEVRPVMANSDAWNVVNNGHAPS